MEVAGEGRMILMPTHGYGPFREMLLGSVTAQVLHDSKCPVLTGPHLESAIHPNEWFKLQRVLSEVSLNRETDDVLKNSGDWAGQLGAALTALHVFTPVEEGLLPLVEPGAPPFTTKSARRAGEALSHPLPAAPGALGTRRALVVIVPAGCSNERDLRLSSSPYHWALLAQAEQIQQFTSAQHEAYSVNELGARLQIFLS